MKRFLSTIVLLGAFLLPSGLAQTTEQNSGLVFNTEELFEQELSITPKITAKTEVEVDKTLILDAGQTAIPKGVSPSFTWSIGENTIERGEEVIVAFSEPGTYHITLTVDVEGKVFTAETDVFVYKKVITFFYNGSDTQLESNLESVKELAADKGVFLNVIPFVTGTPLFTEDSFTQLLLNNIDNLQHSEVIIGGPNGTNLLTSMAKLSTITDQNDDMVIDLAQIPLVVSTKDSLWLQTRVAERLRGTLSTEHIFITQNDPFAALNFYLQSADFEQFLQKLPGDSIVRISASEHTSDIFFPFSNLLTMGIARGVPSEVLVFILFLPFLMTINVFLKQVVGVETLGVFKTIILTLSFLILGVSLGTLILALAFAIGVAFRIILQKAPILYTARNALLLSTASVGLLLLITLGSQVGMLFGLDSSGGDKALLSVFPMLLIAIQADVLSLIVVKQRDTRDDIIRLISTFFAVILGYVLIKIDLFELTLLALPELVFIAFILQYLIGRYAGLRMMEYLHFRELFKHELEE